MDFFDSGPSKSSVSRTLHSHSEESETGRRIRGMNRAAMISRKPPQDKLISLLFLVILVSFPAACGSVYSPARTGNRPDTNLLESVLRLGESTRADVLTALGEPIGRGIARLPVDPRPNAGTIWSYYYTEYLMGNLLSQDPVNANRGIFLLVYFEGDTYDGYMWFSSLPK
jgi:hypothetical protein